MTSVCGMCDLALEDGYLCRGCTLGTFQRLARMPRLYDALAAFLQPSGRRPELGGTRPAEAPLPISEPAFNLRGPGGIVGVLEDWRSAMQADRGWGEPAATGLMDGRILRASRALSQNLEWIAGSWPMAGQFALEIRDLERDVVSIVHPQDPADRGIRVGKCPAVDDSGNLCGAVLRYRPKEGAITCKWCHSSFPPDTWVDLRDLLDEDSRNEIRNEMEEAS